LRLAYVTWRNRSRLREYSGGNVAREYLIAKVAELAGADEVVGITLEDLDSGASRILSPAPAASSPPWGPSGVSVPRSSGGA
jgi:hypothetical protein